jgi:DNA end-binding protein Ku
MQTLVERKLEAGEDVVSLPEDREAPEPEGGEVIDLMEVLKRRLEDSAPPDAKDEGDGAQRATPLERRTKAQLYARARELDIRGRSNMTRDQLIAAIREAG